MFCPLCAAKSQIFLQPRKRRDQRAPSTGATYQHVCTRTTAQPQHAVNSLNQCPNSPSGRAGVVNALFLFFYVMQCATMVGSVIITASCRVTFAVIIGIFDKSEVKQKESHQGLRGRFKITYTKGYGSANWKCSVRSGARG